jgi:cytochrome c-type biogenesis protein
MNRTKPWLLAVPIAIVLVAVSLGAFHLSTQAAGPREAPDFTIETLHHGNFTLSDHRGSMVLIDLMAVDCPTCRITEQSLLRLSHEHDEIVIISVNIWTQVEDEAYLEAHMRQLNASWAYGMDTDDVIFKYNAYEISKVVVVDEHGLLQASAQGAVGHERLKQLIDPTLSTSSLTGSIQTTPALPMGLAGFALLAGFASFFAPCAFPLLPGYMAYTLSLRNQGPPGAASKRSLHALAPGLAAATGILLVYAVFGLLAALLGSSARGWLPLLQPTIGVLAIILGIALLLGATMTRIVAPLQQGVDRLVQLVTRRSRPGTLTGYFSYGLGYGAAAAACTAPVFMTLILAGFLIDWTTGLQVFFVYAGTAAALMVLVTLLAVHAQGLLARQNGNVVGTLNRASGIILIGAGLYLIFYYQRAFGLPFLG